MKKMIPLLLVLLLWTGCLFACNQSATDPVTDPGEDTAERYTETNETESDPPESETAEFGGETTTVTEETTWTETVPATEPITDGETEPVTLPSTDPPTEPVTEPETDPSAEPETEPETTAAHIHEYDPDGASYELVGTSCAEGVREILRCTLCGEETTQILREHIPCLTRRVDLADHGYCGGYLSSEACLCGEYRNYGWNLFCDYTAESGTYTDAEGHTVETTTYRCGNCALELRYRYYKVTAPNTCEALVHAGFDRLAEGEATEIFSCQRNWYEHVYSYAWEEGITSCEAGVTVSLVCQYCGHVDSSETITEHTYYETSRHEWTDHGLCGGYVSVLACPCGQYENYDWQLTCAHNTCETETRVDGAGRDVTVSTHSCADCGRALRYTACTAPADTPCGVARTGVFEVLDGETVISSVAVRHNWDEHIYVHTWDGEITSCTEGVTVSSACARCGERQPDRTVSDHEILRISHEDLAEKGFCGGSVERFSCPCGAFEDYAVSLFCRCTPDSVSYVNEDGYEVTEETYTCGDCGRTLTHTRHTESAEDSCEVTVRASVTYLDGETACELTACSRWLDHHYVRTWDEDVTSCAEGITIRYACADCGEGYEVTFTEHIPFETELYDLADFGLCGGFLSLTACPCGACHNYDWAVVCGYQTEESEYPDGEGNTVHLTRLSCADCGGELRYSYTTERDEATGDTITHAVFEIVVDQIVTKTITCLKSGGNSGYMM